MKLGLAREVVIQKAFGDAGGLGNLAHGDLFKGVFGEQLAAGGEDLAAAFVDVESGVGGLGHNTILVDRRSTHCYGLADHESTRTIDNPR